MEAEGKRERKGGSDVCVFKGAAVPKGIKKLGVKIFDPLAAQFLFTASRSFCQCFFPTGSAHLFFFTTTLMPWLVLVSCWRAHRSIYYGGQRRVMDSGQWVFFYAASGG